MVSFSDFDAAVSASRGALQAIGRGDPEPSLALWTRRDDAVLTNPLRAAVTGWANIEADLPPEQIRQRIWWAKAFANFTETFDAFGLVDHLRTLPENHDGLGPWVELPDQLK